MKPYSKELLIRELKGQGIDSDLEEVAGAIVNGVFTWLRLSALLSQTKYDDLAVPVYSLLQPIVDGAVDKFDGEDDPGR